MTHLFPLINGSHYCLFSLMYVGYSNYIKCKLLFVVINNSQFSFLSIHSNHSTTLFRALRIIDILPAWMHWSLKCVCDFSGMSHILSTYSAENWFPSPDGEHSCSCIMGIVLLLFHLANSEQEVLDQSGNSFTSLYCSVCSTSFVFTSIVRCNMNIACFNFGIAVLFRTYRWIIKTHSLQ